MVAVFARRKLSGDVPGDSLGVCLVPVRRFGLIAAGERQDWVLRLSEQQTGAKTLR